MVDSSLENRILTDGSTETNQTMTNKQRLQMILDGMPPESYRVMLDEYDRLIKTAMKKT